MKDVTMYSDEELSLIFLNDEFSYIDMRRSIMRHNSFIRFADDHVKESYIFTPEQLEDLEETYNNEWTEYWEE